MSTRQRKSVRSAILSMLMAGVLVIPTVLPPVQASTSEFTESNPQALQNAFEQAAAEFGVPLSVLMSVAYNESRWDHHGAEPSMSGGYGVMHLTQYDPELAHGSKGDEEEERPDAGDPALHTLDAAAKLLGEDPEVLKQDLHQNIRGGAALLAQYARETVGTLPTNAGDWYGAVAKYSGSEYADVAKDFADVVYSTIQTGAERTNEHGQHAVLKAEAVTPNPSTAEPLHLRNQDKTDANCPNGLACRYIPATYKPFSSMTDYGNYDLANRPADGLDIKYIIIHDVEGSYNSAIKTFQSKSYVSSHYVVNSENGQVTEMVRPENVAWHAGNWFFNSHSIGIEHSGFAVEGATWYSEQMYRSSAKLVKYLAERYNIPLDRQHILGHDDLPGLTTSAHAKMHWDPGAYFDWAHYFSLLGASINPAGSDKDSDIVTIDVNFKQNEQTELRYNNRILEPQPSNFVYMRTEPRHDAPLISDAALQPTGKPGTTQIYDWGNKATIGQSFYKVDEQGDWTAVYFGGKKAWFHNPNNGNASPGQGVLITPKAGLTSIPVYGAAFPEAAAYTGTGVPVRANNALQYRIPAGQVYVSAGEPIQSAYFHAKIFNAPETNRVIKGNDEYYQINFNHRSVFVKKSDVEVVSN